MGKASASGWHCSGTLINNNTILTNAHCITRKVNAQSNIISSGCVFTPGYASNGSEIQKFFTWSALIFESGLFGSSRGWL